MKIRKIVFAAAFAALLVPLGAEELLRLDLASPETADRIFKAPVSRDFTRYSKEKFTLNCKTESGTDCIERRYLNVTPPEEYTFKLDFVVTDHQKHHHVGVKAGNLHFVIRQLTAYINEPGKEEEVASMKTFQKGKHAVYVFSVGKERVKVFLNGTRVSDLPRGKFPENEISFYAYNVNLDVFDVSLESGDATGAMDSANLLRNSSFETVTNGEYPDYWGTAHWGINGHREYMADMNLFRQRFHVDELTAYDGKRSFVIETREKSDSMLQLVANYAEIPAHTDLTFSVYLKADKPDSKVILSSFDFKHQKSFLIGTEWTRCEFVIPGGDAAKERVRIIPTALNTVFHIDAAQLEAGKSATAYRPHQNELKTDMSEVPVITPVMTAEAPTLDGVLDETVWKEQKPIELKTLNDPKKPCREKTLLRLACDSDNVYFAVECFSADTSKLVANVKAHKGPVWNDDCVEFFLRQGKNSNSYFQFGVNSINTRYEGATLADVAWNAYWETAVKVDPDRYVVEACIPISSICAGNVADVYFNVGRENQVCKEWSALSSPSQTFLEQKNYPELRLPSMQTITASDVQLRHENLIGKTRTLSFSVASAVGKDEALKAVVTMGGISQEVPFIARKNAETPVAVGGLEVPVGKTVKVGLELRGENNKLWFTNSFTFSDAPCCTIIPEYSWFGAEKEFRFKFKNSALDVTPQDAVWEVKSGKQTLASGKFKTASAETLFAVPAVKTPGKYELTVSIGSKTVAALPFIAAGKDARAPRTNRFRGSFVTADNREIFMWTVYCEGCAYMARTLQKEAGVNHVLLRMPFSETYLAETLAECEKGGIYFTVSLPENGKVGTLPESFPMLKKVLPHPNLLFVDTLDEMTCKTTDFPFAEDVARVRAECGDLVPIARNENDLGIMMHSDFSAYDVVGVDHYTIPERDISSVRKIVGSMREQNPDKVLFYWAQSCGNAYGYGREPTADELVAQVYQSFASEVWNVGFFANFAIASYVFPTIKRLKAERDELLLKDNFVDMTPINLKCSSPAIAFTARRSGGRMIVVTVNATREPVCAHFAFKGIGEVKVKFENRTAKTDSDGWQDDYQPLERHVYEITLK